MKKYNNKVEQLISIKKLMNYRNQQKYENILVEIYEVSSYFNDETDFTSKELPND